MFHVSEFFAIWPTQKLSPIGSARAISSRIMNVVDGTKLGSIQSLRPSVSASNISAFIMDMFERNLPFRVPLTKIVSKMAALLSALVFRRATLFTTIVEDFAYYDNRIIPDSASPSGFSIEYDTHKELTFRVSLMRKLIRRQLARHKIAFLSAGDNLNYGHPSGTCRFGKLPESSVLTPENRVHGMNNLYVIDASFFPSSGGINPSLTIAANALRVADIINQRFARDQMTERT
jgi:choline dehydrogenase-like flavoprotein